MISVDLRRTFNYLSPRRSQHQIFKAWSFLLSSSPPRPLTWFRRVGWGSSPGEPDHPCPTPPPRPSGRQRAGAARADGQGPFNPYGFQMPQKESLLNRVLKQAWGWQGFSSRRGFDGEKYVGVCDDKGHRGWNELEKFFANESVGRSVHSASQWPCEVDGDAGDLMMMLPTRMMRRSSYCVQLPGDGERFSRGQNYIKVFGSKTETISKRVNFCSKLNLWLYKSRIHQQAFCTIQCWWIDLTQSIFGIYR